ncbi:hypothetical protein [Streptomyces sp. NPDC093149]|uniref:hypothetical protein n=1 Tax=Streptomyces sp. NPDC093149 TaxID=3366031 RepID=UPI00382D40C1
MKTWRTRNAAPSAAALAAATGVLLAGCSDGDGGTRAKPTPAPALTPAENIVKVTDKALGEALERLVFHDTRSSSKDGGACLAFAARDAGMSEKTLTYIVKADDDDAGTVIDGLEKTSEEDAALLASRPLREDFDACVDKAVLPSGGETQSYEPPKAAAKPAAGKPAYAIRADQPINSSMELAKGLVSMFSSYARDESQKKTYGGRGMPLSPGVRRGLQPGGAALPCQRCTPRHRVNRRTSIQRQGQGDLVVTKVHPRARRLHNERDTDCQARLLSRSPPDKRRTLRDAPGPLFFAVT